MRERKDAHIYCTYAYVDSYINSGKHKVINTDIN